MIPIVFDTDIGTDVDDALALAYILATPDLELVAVSVTSGPVDIRARVAARLLGLAGRPEVPVVIGNPERLQPTKLPTHLGHEGTGLLELPFSGTEATVVKLGTSAFLSAVSLSRPTHLVTTGPLTAVAHAILADPGLAGRLAAIHTMGGAVDRRRLPDPWRSDMTKDPVDMDYNTACDPAAALVVATSGASITWTPIEITMQTPLRRPQLDRIAAIGHPFTDALVQLADVWHQRFMKALGNPWGGDETVAVLHDPLTVSALLREPWLDVAEIHLGYEVEGDRFRVSPDPHGYAAQLVSGADGDRFAHEFVLRLEAMFTR
ncbi:MAG: nucleoside hydrolase [Candidatus Dormibacteria bacterium]